MKTVQQVETETILAMGDQIVLLEMALHAAVNTLKDMAERPAACGRLCSQCDKDSAACE